MTHKLLALIFTVVTLLAFTAVVHAGGLDHRARDSIHLESYKFGLINATFSRAGKGSPAAIKFHATLWTDDEQNLRNQKITFTSKSGKFIHCIAATDKKGAMAPVATL